MMRAIRLKQLMQMTPVVAGILGLTGLTMDAGYASELSKLEDVAAPETASLSTAALILPSESQAELAATFEPLSLSTPTRQASGQPLFVQDPALLTTPQRYVFQARPLANPLVDPQIDPQANSQVDPQADLQRSDTVASAVSGSDSDVDAEVATSGIGDLSNSAQTPPFEPFTSNSADLGSAQSVDHQSIAQAETPAETPAETNSPDPVPDSEDASPRWRFTLTPYAFVPVSVEGSATVRDFTADVDLGLDDVLDPLNFAAAGRIEAWRGRLGLIFDGSYFNLSQENTRSLSIPNCLCNIFPSEITADVKVQYGQFDLGVGYRAGDNVDQAQSDFELGPLAFDAIVGVRIYALRQEIDLSTNLGTSRNLEGSGTLVQPLVSGRLRWNLSPKLAGWVRGDLAGLGIGGTLMAASFTGGIDWVFAGDTSLLLAYRMSSLEYNTEIGGENLELNLLFHGPYLGVVFRF